MKAPQILLSLFLLVLSTDVGLHVHAEANAGFRRQASSSSVAPAPAPSTDSASSSSVSTAALESSSRPSSGSESATSKLRGTVSASTTASVSSNNSSATAASNGGTFTSSGVVFGPSATAIANTTLNGTTMEPLVIDGLPIQPTITPAIAVAGAIMIVTGMVYTLVGIKTQRVQIFFSTTYLVALAVTVLIEYVMHPPISNGIQGAYLVAICATGLIFGALAIIFADVTEGLGCFLGGFCLSMWFMVLKPDGLIGSTAGKAIFIGCFTVVGFGFYLSRYTRVYGLIGSTSFAGATVVVLGVDCFSRAGLKEFWLWIWNLNDGLFPLNYAGPYPITRGIRVEIASIILLFILGVMSQIKIWKIVKKRKEERVVEQKRKEEERERSEEALGRRIEAGNNEERSMWDAIYGDKAKLKESNIDSGIGTEAPSTAGKSSTSIHDFGEVYEGGMEMHNLDGSRFDREKDGRITVHVAQEDDITEAPKTLAWSSLQSTPEKLLDMSASKVRPTDTESVTSGAASTTSKVSRSIDPGLTLKVSSKPPKLVPLPFTIPNDSPEHRRKSSDASSVATVDASEYLPEQQGESPKMLSGSEPKQKHAARSKKEAIASSMSPEPFHVPHIEDDRSSIAATVDMVSDHVDSDPALSAANGSGPEKGVSSSNKVKAPSPTSTAPRTVLDAANEKSDERSQAASSEGLASLIGQSNLLAENLPESGASKVINSFRTNEWAKHLDRADAPSIEDLRIQRTRATKGEKAAPLDVKALSQTAVTADPARGVTKIVGDKARLPSSRSEASSAGKPTNPYRAPKSSRTPRANSSGSTMANNMETTTSQTSLASSVSSSAEPAPIKTRSSGFSLAGPRALRTSSTPHLGTPLVESPIEEGVEASFPFSRFTPSTSHLMSQRESILRSKPASTSLIGSRTSLNRVSSANNIPTSSSMGLEALDEDDNISLSQRKSMLQQQQGMSRSTSGATTPFNASRTSLNANNPYRQTARFSDVPNPHLNSNPPHAARPLLASAGSSEVAISNWRASLAQLPTSEVQQQQEMDLRRRELINEKNAVRYSRALEERSREQRESVLGREMRRGSMMDAHQKAMRKMQASVNENLRPPGT